MARTDVHSPKNFVPTDYSIIDYFDKHLPVVPRGASPASRTAAAKILKEWRDERRRLFGDRTNLICDHCGKTNVMIVVAAHHIPSGKRVCIGWICAEEKLNLTVDEYQRKRLMQYRKSVESRIMFAQIRQEFAEKHPIEVAWLMDEKRTNSYALSFRNQLENNGSLSERQMEIIQKMIPQEAAYQERKAVREAVLSTAPPAPEGVVTVEGVILSTKYQVGMHGEEIPKMLMELTDHNRVYVTIPKSVPTNVVGDYKGRRLRFTATFTRSTKDNHFSFGKRPKQVQIL